MNFTTLAQTAPISAEQAGQSLWMIIALPLLGALLCGVFGKSLGRANTHLIACGAVLGSFFLSLFVWWVGSSRVDLQACKLEYSIVSPK